MARKFPSIQFARYADDIVFHCRSLRQAHYLWDILKRRFAVCGLTLHPAKTRIVYCKDSDRRGEYPATSFDFLEYTFRPRRSKSKRGNYFVNFSPAISAKAAKAIRQEIRSWRLHLRTDKDLDDLARMFNPMISGWINYYGAFYKSALYPLPRLIDRRLVGWCTRKMKRFRRHRRRAYRWLSRCIQRDPSLFAHWGLLHRAVA